MYPLSVILKTVYQCSATCYCTRAIWKCL